MNTWKPIANPACCMYCKQEFIARGKKRWHGCPESLKVKRLEDYQRSKDWKNKTHYKQPGREKGVIDKTGWKLCKRCGRVLTPNYFGNCNNCLKVLGTLYDLDAIMTFERGSEKRSGWLR